MPPLRRNQPTTRQSQGKRWCFTLNNYTEEEHRQLLSTICTYCVIGKEVGEEGTPHLQGYFVFNTNKRFNAVRRLNGRCHWELAGGTTEENYIYCTKDANFEERGVKPRSIAEQAQDQKAKWTDFIRSAKEGTTETEYPREHVQYNSYVGRTYCPVVETIDTYSGHWFYGRPGIGKSRTARRLYPGAYDKLLNKWWDGYKDEETVLIDDIGRDHKHMGSFLKRYADHYPFRAEYKGGSKVIRPKCIVVTSNYKIEEIFADDRELVDALKRRYTFRDFNLE